MISIESFDHCSVLIVDDQTTSRAILAQVVKGINPKITITEKSSPEQALEWAKSNTADLVFVDYLMPEMNGIEFVSLLKEKPNFAHVPVMMITIKKEIETRNMALSAGVTDFIHKPFDMYECMSRSKNLLIMHVQHTALQKRNTQVKRIVDKANAEIRVREKETLMRLAHTGEHGDSDTTSHLRRISLYSKALAEAIGLDAEEAEAIELAAPLHDIGKVTIPDRILLKQDALNDEELRIMRKHSHAGFKMLENSPSKYLQKGAEIALSHHERYDGTGYPAGLKGNEIPLAARIVAIADVFDALTNYRPYKNTWGFEDAYQYIIQESGRHFDPALVAVMAKVKEIFIKIYTENSNATRPHELALQ